MDCTSLIKISVYFLDKLFLTNWISFWTSVNIITGELEPPPPRETSRHLDFTKQYNVLKIVLKIVLEIHDMESTAITIFNTFFLTWNRTYYCMTAISLKLRQTHGWGITHDKISLNLEKNINWKWFFRRGHPSNKLGPSITWSWRWARAWATTRQQSPQIA